jgi:beta-phosphoglucomutase
MLKAIVWDVDGVIVDSEPVHYRAFVEVSQRFGVSFTWQEYQQTYIGFDDRDVFALLLDAGAKQNAALPGIEELCIAKAAAFERLVAAGITAMPGALALIAQTAAQMPVAIASGATQRDLALMLGQLGVLDHFKTIVAADNVARSKPDPESYRAAVQQLAASRPDAGLVPANCLAIEDTAAGIASARGAGLMSLGVAAPNDAGPLGKADRVIATLQDVSVPQLHDWFG